MNNLKVRLVNYATRARDLLKQHVALVLMTALALSLYATPSYATSFSINTTDLLSAAADIFNGLWPAFAIVAGLGLGIALVRFIVNSLKSVF